MIQSLWTSQKTADAGKAFRGPPAAQQQVDRAEGMNCLGRCKR